ncbi:MAG TPA: hypothetical protein VFI47_15415 [Acidimicrobiales bacterium]|nr:hypothetical protein [Acidimicrobiales bacterium]
MADTTDYLDMWTQQTSEAQRLLAEIANSKQRTSIAERVTMAQAYATLAISSAIAAAAVRGDGVGK